ncbi:hypothetical protein NE473_31675, partial [Hungatella sp. SL.1.14]|nr:hypothetical protein [Hungatella sp. SL.1.14]
SWFSQWDQVEISWNYIKQLKQLAASRNLPLYPYLPGTRGPREAETLLNTFGHHWLEYVYTSYPMESRVNKYFFIDYFTAAAVRLSPETFLYQERSPVI